MSVVTRGTRDPREVAAAVGEELGRVRRDLDWTRPDLVERVPGLTLRTLEKCENGYQPWPLAKLVTLCDVMAVPAPDVLALAMQRRLLDLEAITLQIDLHTVATESPHPAHPPLRKWALALLDRGLHQHGVARTDPAAVVRLAQVLTIRPGVLAGYIYPRGVRSIHEDDRRPPCDYVRPAAKKAPGRRGSERCSDHTGCAPAPVRSPSQPTPGVAINRGSRCA